MTDIYHLDFETRWSTEYSVTKMSVIEYVLDPRFYVHMLGIARNNEMPIVLANDEIEPYFKRQNLNNAVIQSFNNQFDGLILAQKYNIKPKLWLDSLSMARAFLPPVLQRNDLGSVASYMQLGHKGTNLIQSKGHDFLPHEIFYAIAEYCRQDVHLSRRIYQTLKPKLTKDLIRLMDWVTRMATEPCLQINTDILEKLISKETKDKQKLAAKLLMAYDIHKIQLTSSKQFAGLLVELGVDPPTKISPTTGLQTFAFAKTDTEYLALGEHPKKAVRVVYKARRIFKSIHKLSRAEAYYNVGKVAPAWPVGIRYAGAVQTKRTSGNKTGGGNPQNLTRGSELRDAIYAPDGFTLVVADSKNIELRVCRTLAGCHEEMLAMHNGLDLYKSMASDIYFVSYDEVTKIQRFLGKTAELSLQYQSGSKKFQLTCDLAGIDLEAANTTSYGIVNMWRKKWFKVVDLWNMGQSFIQAFPYSKPDVSECTEAQTVLVYIAKRAGLHYDYKLKATPAIYLPDGLTIDYAGLNRHSGTYNHKNVDTNIYGGKVMQNWSQALANCVMQWQVNELLKQKIRPAMFVHDEVAVCCPYDEADDIAKAVKQVMSTPPPWWPKLLVDVSIDTNDVYGEAK